MMKLKVSGCFALAGLLVLPPSHIVHPAAPKPPAKPIAVVEGLSIPEAVSFDAAHDFYFVSNVNGAPGNLSGNAFITRITADGKLDSLHFIQGGRNGAVLHGPLGSRIRGDTLWVLDVDALRAFDTRTGAPLASIDFASFHPQLLNDLAFMPNGDVYVTDTGWLDSATAPRAPVSFRIFRVTRDRKVTVALEGATLMKPDGIDWDARRKAFVLAPLGGKAMQSWKPGDAAPVDVATGAGEFDGLEIGRDGRVLLTSWGDSTVAELRGGRIVKLIGPMPAAPADIARDTRRGRIGVVLLTANRFELWALPKVAGSD